MNKTIATLTILLSLLCTQNSFAISDDLSRQALQLFNNTVDKIMSFEENENKNFANFIICKVGEEDTFSYAVPPRWNWHIDNIVKYHGEAIGALANRNITEGYKTSLPEIEQEDGVELACLLYTSPSPRDS